MAQTWHDGTGYPSVELGESGDYFLRIDNNDIFKKIDFNWIRIGNVQGKTGSVGPRGFNGEHGRDGFDGVDGLDGKDGNNWLNGIGEPSNNIGRVRDMYLELVGADIYEKVSDSSWDRIGNIKPPQTRETPTDDCGLTEDITSGVTVGNLSPGSILKKGSSLTQVMRQILVTPPTYILPRLTMASSIASIEVGKTISPTIMLNFIKNDAGEPSRYSIKEGSNEIATTQSIKIPDFVAITDRTFTGLVDYLEGPIKTNSAGELDSTGRIPAGTLTSSVTVKAYRPYFGFSSNSSSAPTSSFIRLQDISGLNLGNGGTIRVTTSSTSRMVCFAYPATLRDCTKIRYEDLNDDNNKSAFTSILLDIADASGGNPIQYRVYYYIAPIPFGLNATFTLTV